jgi:hypothetical protein
MLDDLSEPLTITAADARDHVAELESERALALTTGLAANGDYMHDLEDELAVVVTSARPSPKPKSQPCAPSCPVPRPASDGGARDRRDLA